MQPFEQALLDVQAGWSPRQAISDRAFAILDDAPDAELLADEIERLQAAAHTLGGTPPDWATHIWRVKPRAWAKIIARGGYRVGRHCWGTANAPYCVLHDLRFADLERLRPIDGRNDRDVS